MALACGGNFRNASSGLELSISKRDNTARRCGADFLCERRAGFLDRPRGIWQDFGIAAGTFLVLSCRNPRGLPCSAILL